MRYSHLSVVASIMLFVAVMEMPYGYYTLMRIVVCITCVYGGLQAHAYGKENWLWILGALAVLFNPLIPIYLERGIWVPIDIISGITIFISSKSLTKPETENELK